MEIVFDNPVFLWFLALLPLLIALHFYSLRYIRNKAMRFANFEALEKIVEGGKILPKNRGLLLLRILTLIGFTISAAGVGLKYELVSVQYDYMLVIDSSSSMLAQDFYPNRMEGSTQKTSQWAVSLPKGSRLGLVSFASQPELLSPPTEDIQSVSNKIKEIYVSKSGGTAICEALKISTNSLLNTTNPRGIILLSDGQNNVGCPLDEGIEYAKDNDVSVFPIGIGSQKGEISGIDEMFFTLDEKGMQKIANQTGGKYYRAKNENDLAGILNEISQKSTKMYTEPLGTLVMFFSFILVFIDWGLSLTRYRAIPT